MGVSGRITVGLRKPARPDPPPVPPRASLEQALCLFRLIQPWAAPRLPANELACFDHRQRQIKPLPGQKLRDFARRPAVRVPAQRKPHPLDRLEAQRARR